MREYKSQVFASKIILATLAYALEKASNLLPFRFVCLSYNALTALYHFPGLPRLIEVGCYKDSQSNRALRTLFAYLRKEIDWYNLRSMVTKCAERAWSRGFRYMWHEYKFHFIPRHTKYSQSEYTQAIFTLFSVR